MEENTKVEEKKSLPKGRTRSIEIGKSSPIAAVVDELAPDLNGDQQTKIASPTPLEANTDAEPPKTDTPPQGRKRKASEMKSDDSGPENSAEEIVPVETPLQSTTQIDNLTSTSALSANSADASEPQIRKGKRARIPNKRYDVAIPSYKGGFAGFPKETNPTGVFKTTLDKLMKEVENGEVTSSMDLTEEPYPTPDIFELSSNSITARLSQKLGLRDPPTPGSSSKKQKPIVDLTDPAFLKPFDFGWRRELVYRATGDSSGSKKNGDIYYYTPTGKKVRSMREVSENLMEKTLNMNNFTFFKEPLGLNDPEKEIIRDAKVKTATMSTSTPVAKKATPKAKAPKTLKTPKEKAVAASPKPAVVAATPSPKTPKTPSLGGFKVKLPGRATPASGAKSKAQQKKKSAALESNEVVSGMLPPDYASPPKKTPARTSARPGEDGKPYQPCSIRCLGVSGLIPSLQCRLCLCLYHNECVGLSPLDSNIGGGGYVCKNCQLDNQDPSTSLSDAIPTLPPSSSANALNKTHYTHSIIPPNLQRPRLGDGLLNTASNSNRTDNFANLLRYPRPNDSAPGTYPENTNLVGSVTTWFPPSSTIQLGNHSQSDTGESDVVSTPRPQHVEFVGGRKYLVVPKHNVLSFSPNIATAASTPAHRPILGANPPINLAADVPEEDSASRPHCTPLGASPLAPNPDQDREHSSASVPIPSPIVQEQSGEKEQSAATQDVAVAADVPSEEAERFPAAETLENAKALPKAKKPADKPAIPAVPKSEEDTFMENYLQNLAFGYNTLLYVFQHLKVQDLLRAGCVCSMWRDISRHSTLWRTVRMKNSQIHNFEGLADALEKYGTVNLDLRKMLVPSIPIDKANSDKDASSNADAAQSNQRAPPNNAVADSSSDAAASEKSLAPEEKIWPSFSKAIARATSLRRIDLCRCPAKVIESLADSNPFLEVINAVTIKCSSMDLAPLSNLRNLKELRLKSTAGFSLTSDLTALRELKHLKVLSLTSIKDLHEMNIEIIGDLPLLEALDLGECMDFPESFASDILPKLRNLKKLRLEKGQGSCCTFDILRAVKDIAPLELLELVNFDIKPGFDEALGACSNIRKLLVIPTYISQSATTNHMVLGGILRLQSTLAQFVWGVTLELLRVTELFVDQCDKDLEKKDGDRRERRRRDQDKKDKGGKIEDSIPVLKPVPLLPMGRSETLMAEPQVEILPLPTLQKLMLRSLPTTRVKILKIPFHATWRQSIVDTIN